MSSQTYVFFPDIPFVNQAKTKEQIAHVLNERYPKGAFDSSKIIISKKDDKYNAYAQTTQEHQQMLLALKEIKIANQTVPLKKCFPHHQIYINKLPDNFNRDDIEKHFGKYGKIVSIDLLQAEGAYEIKEKSNINHCYIRFEKAEDAEKCLFTEDRHSIKNKDDIRVVRAYKIGQNDETDKKLFLKIQPIVQFQTVKFEKDLYDYFIKFGQLREKIRLEQIHNVSSKACITFTSCEAGDKALQNFTLSIHPYTFTLRPYACKQNHMAFVGGLKPNVTEQALKNALSKYGKILNCTISQSKKVVGISNAVVTFDQAQGLNSALASSKQDTDLPALFVNKPYIDVHMTASLRNKYEHFKKKDKKQNDAPIMNMGGIGVGFGMPNRLSMPPGFNNMNQQMGGFNPNMMNPNMGFNNGNTHAGNPNLGMNQNFGNPRYPNQMPSNYRQN